MAIPSSLDQAKRQRAWAVCHRMHESKDQVSSLCHTPNSVKHVNAVPLEEAYCQDLKLVLLQVISIQMASSGVLLMLSADYSGSIHGIRSRFQACIPGWCSTAYWQGQHPQAEMCCICTIPVCGRLQLPEFG